MSDDIVIGVDPGVKGAIALVALDETLVWTYDMPVVGREVNAAGLAEILAQHDDCACVVIENVHSMPKQGVASTFTFGKAVGVVHGVVAALKLPSVLVAPQVWKKTFNLNADKEKSRAYALRVWGRDNTSCFNRKRDADRAEAALIALHHVKTRLTGEPPPV